MIKADAELFGVIKTGSAKDGHFILTMTVAEGTHHEHTQDLLIQDHMGEGIVMEGTDVRVYADVVDNTCVCRGIEEQEPFDPDATVQFHSSLYRAKGVTGVKFEMSTGQLTPNSEKDFRRFVKQAQDHLGIPSLEEDKVIKDEE